MQDVIFNGTQSRSKKNYCEVCLIFDNSDMRIKTDYTEISVRRKMYRSGESEYYINNSGCRLKDILELFRDTGIGAQSIAEEMGVSAAYLRKQYLTEAGVSIGDKLNQLRMDEASRLLLETDQPIESIARQIGVENTKYFFVLFKKFKGMTPRQFRCKVETPLL